MRIYLTSALAILLFGCSPVINTSDNKDLYEMMDVQSSLVSIRLPSTLKIYQKDYGVAAATNHTSKKDQPTDWSTSIRDRVTHSCSANDMGVSDLFNSDLNGTKIVWGKVTFWDNALNGGMVDLPNSNCRPSRPVNRPSYFPCEDPDFVEDYAVPCSVQMRQYEVERGMYSAYALCSEKDGKRVVVCVQQMTDDPELAEEIFSTFRWLE